MNTINIKAIIRYCIIILLFVIWISPVAAQQCPRHLYDCKGACGWFTDSDHDGYCDLTAFSDALIKKSMHKKDSAAEAKSLRDKHIADSIQNAKNLVRNTDTVKQSTTGKEIKSDGNPHQNCPFANTPECDQNKISESNLTNAGTTQKLQEKVEKKEYKIKKYDLVLIFGLCVLVYLISSILSKRKVFKKSTHKKIWNTLLLISFLNTGLTGLFLVIQINYLVFFDWFSDMLFWHVEFGISMAAISILHILWHWKYFWRLLVKRKEDNGTI
ncbi:MAG TPA: hypothetical protein PKW80_12935 [Bacteroidales bacterium]|nr:hypothetical protein [Bacteroidales bacterium]